MKTPTWNQQAHLPPVDLPRGFLGFFLLSSRVPQVHHHLTAVTARRIVFVLWEDVLRAPFTGLPRVLSSFSFLFWSHKQQEKPQYFFLRFYVNRHKHIRKQWRTGPLFYLTLFCPMQQNFKVLFFLNCFLLLFVEAIWLEYGKERASHVEKIILNRIARKHDVKHSTLKAHGHSSFFCDINKVGKNKLNFYTQFISLLITYLPSSVSQLAPSIPSHWIQRNCCHLPGSSSSSLPKSEMFSNTKSLVRESRAITFQKESLTYSFSFS